MADPSTEAAPEKAPPAAPPLLAVGGLGTMDSILRDVSTRLQPEMDRRKEQSERFATSMEESAQRTSSLSAEVAGSFAEKGRIQDQYAAEIAKLQPDKPPEFHETEPLKAFGSYATVLGVLGGLFTRQPLMASLNAASAAMGSIRKRDFESFDYHMKEWRAQSDHAINLLNWQKTRYDAILQKYADKPQEALIQMRIQAAADGNLQMAEAARSGYFDQVVKMKTDMFNMADKLEFSKDRIQQVWEQHNENTLRHQESGRTQDEVERRNKVQESETQRYHDIQRDKPLRSAKGESTYMDLVAQERAANNGEEPSVERKLQLRALVSEAESAGRLDAVRIQQEGATTRTDKNNEAKRDVANIRARSQSDSDAIRKEIADNKGDIDWAKVENSRWFNERKADLIERGWDERAADREARNDIARAKDETERYKVDKRAETAKLIQSGKTTLTNERAKAIEDSVAAAEGTLGRPVTGEERAKIIQHVLKDGLTGNAEDKLIGHINTTDYALKTMDDIGELISKHAMIGGLGGKITRPFEAFGNITTLSNSTDRKQFERDVNLLKEWATSILTGTDRRTYGQDVSKIDSIVAGLNFGDTTDNVVRAYKELDPLVRKIRADLVTRYKGEFDPDKGVGAPGVTPTPAEKTENLKRKRFDQMIGDGIAPGGG